MSTPISGFSIPGPLRSRWNIETDFPYIATWVTGSTLISTFEPKYTGNAPGSTSTKDAEPINLACIWFCEGSRFTVCALISIPLYVSMSPGTDSAIAYPTRFTLNGSSLSATPPTAPATTVFSLPTWADSNPRVEVSRCGALHGRCSVNPYNSPSSQGYMPLESASAIVPSEFNLKSQNPFPSELM